MNKFPITENDVADPMLIKHRWYCLDCSFSFDANAWDLLRFAQEHYWLNGGHKRFSRWKVFDKTKKSGT